MHIVVKQALIINTVTEVSLKSSLLGDAFLSGQNMARVPGLPPAVIYCRFERPICPFGVGRQGSPWLRRCSESMTAASMRLAIH